MTYSMTGFGHYTLQNESIEIRAQLRSVNHRGLDTRIVTNPSSPRFEIEALPLFREHIGRGRVELFITVETAQRERPGFDLSFAQKRLQDLKILATALDLHWSEERFIPALLKAHDLWRDQGNDLSSEIDQHLPLLMEATIAALHALNQTRKTEGQRLHQGILEMHQRCTHHLEHIAQRAPERISEFQKRILERVAALAQELPLDPQRLAQEVAIIAEKADIQEELLRAQCHLDAIADLFPPEPPPTLCMGKKLDFYLQELNREVSTIAAKAKDSDIAQHTIELRALIDAMREQSANLQ